MLHAGDVEIRYGDRAVLAGVTLTISKGETVAIVGPSGAGKSSLLLCLCGLIQPSIGHVELDGYEISSLPTRQRDRLRREHFGFVFQFGDLVPELTLAENVGLPLRLLGTDRKTAQSQALTQMETLGIVELADAAITDVSGGELQRAAICRALVHSPKVVLADEPTGALDEHNAALVFDQLTAHAARQGAAVLAVTHETWLARRADRTLRIDGGRLGSP